MKAGPSQKMAFLSSMCETTTECKKSLNVEDVSAYSSSKYLRRNLVDHLVKIAFLPNENPAIILLHKGQLHRMG